jgi:hypothetical protein
MPLGYRDTDDLSVHGGGILRVGCIEKRLGRRLTVDDFSPITLDFLRGSQSTPRLLSRLGVDVIAAAAAPLPQEAVKPWAESVLKIALAHEPAGKGLTKVEVDGEAVLLIYKGRREAVRYRAGPGIRALMAELRRDRLEEAVGTPIDLLAWE